MRLQGALWSDCACARRTVKYWWEFRIFSVSQIIFLDSPIRADSWLPKDFSLSETRHFRILWPFIVQTCVYTVEWNRTLPSNLQNVIISHCFVLKKIRFKTAMSRVCLHEHQFINVIVPLAFAENSAVFSEVIIMIILKFKLLELMFSAVLQQTKI